MLNYPLQAAIALRGRPDRPRRGDSLPRAFVDVHGGFATSVEVESLPVGRLVDVRCLLVQSSVFSSPRSILVPLLDVSRYPQSCVFYQIMLNDSTPVPRAVCAGCVYSIIRVSRGTERHACAGRAGAMRHALPRAAVHRGARGRPRARLRPAQALRELPRGRRVPARAMRA